MSERKEKFTPGPWRQEGNRVYPTCDYGRKRHYNGPICSVSFPCFCDESISSQKEAEAIFDATLIKCAPDMYRDLKEAVATMCMQCQREYEHTECADKICRVKQWRETLEKARGEK